MAKKLAARVELDHSRFEQQAMRVQALERQHQNEMRAFQGSHSGGAAPRQGNSGRAGMVHAGGPGGQGHH